MTDMELMQAAKAARANAYAPYSGFRVGAALLCTDGRVFCGCNVESASYGATCCAERTALYAAIAAGAREFISIAVAGGRGDGTDGACYPCGICRQVLAEHGAEELRVLTETDGGVAVHFIKDLLPLAFSLSQTSGENEDENV